MGLRNIKDYKMRVRPDGESVGQASPFNVITKVLPMRLFSEAEMRSLYAQHTAETGQVFEEGALTEAYRLSCGQPYLVNALARWCVEEIHHDDYTQPITAADMAEAKEGIIRERVTTLNSIQKRLNEKWMRRALGLIGRMVGSAEDDRNAVSLAFAHGVVVERDGVLDYSCPIVKELVDKYGR